MEQIFQENHSIHRIFGKKQTLKEVIRDYQFNRILVVAILFCIFAGGALLCFLIVYCRNRRNARRAVKSSPLMETPKKPFWLHQERKSCNMKITQISDRLKFYTRPYIRKIEPRSQLPYDEIAIQHLQVVLGDIYDHTERRRIGTLRKETCIIQLAKRDFKCGRNPEEFIPVSLKGAEHHFSYQMFGRDAVQATWFYSPLEHRKILAGVTIYIESPYSPTFNFSRALLWNLLVAEPNLFPEQVHHESTTFNDREAITNELISHFCKLLKQPVMLYKKDGVMVHMEWDTELKTFQYCECTKCDKDMEEQEDEPPSYQNATHQLLHEY